MSTKTAQKTLVAASATAVLGPFLLMTGPTMPAIAQAECAEWQLTYPTFIYQSNGWAPELANPTLASVPARHEVDKGLGDVTIQSVTASNVKFIITWQDGTGGMYNGRIDPNVFVAGITQDKWHPESQAEWHMEKLARCVK